MDPFETKWLDSEHGLYKDLIEYRSSSVLSANFSNDTSLVYLVLKSNVSMTESQIAKVLGLNLENDNSKNLFSQIKHEVITFSKELFNRSKLTSLLEIPLTDFKEACYTIGEHFKGIFFVPVTRKIQLSGPIRPITRITYGRLTEGNSDITLNNANFVQNSGSEYSMPSNEAYSNLNIEDSSISAVGEEELVEFRSRFNQMWIIVLWINKEYQKFVINYKNLQ